MKTTKYLLIGGGLANAMAAKKIREVDPSGSITLVCQEHHLPYNRPPLDKEYMQGKEPLEKVFVEAAEFYRTNRIETILGDKVTHLDPAAHTATLATGPTLKWEKCLLATGGTPARLNIPGDGLSGIHYFRTLDDAIAVSESARAGRKAVILGGGFIGVELASSLTQRGMGVTLIDRGEHLWRRFADPKLGDFFQSYCRQRGVAFEMNQKVAAIEGDDRCMGVRLDNGRTLPCDLVVIAAGIELNLDLARQAGLKIDNGVVVDAHMRTSHPDIYAAGDIANYPDPYFDTRRRVEHWGQAEYTGGLAGGNMAGEVKTYDLLTYVWSDIFDLHLEFAGDEHNYDRVVMRGSTADPSFAALYLKGSRVTAYFAINYKKAQYRKLAKLIESKVDVSRQIDKLADPNFDVEQLLTVGVVAGK